MPSTSPGLHPCQVLDPDTSAGNVAAEAGRLRFSPPGRGRMWLAGASAPGHGITLSDVEEQGERAHSPPFGALRLWLRCGRLRVQINKSAA